ncbi:MAG: UDP-N-acetylmuramoyl-L-alanyl-D-glutamate--2,6-diaminopimelate ligase [Phycisphaerae bacterium]|nr:UDP-N-acetylmuramoyl-L-alanyl-D-glutamate--2,6-diaminopimelate ligase [Phycisphaerae bacterium]
MRFSKLLDDAEIAPKQRSGEADVTGVAADSRLCKRGTCFVAVRGTAVDGHAYIRSAVTAGSAAVVCEDAHDVPADIAFAVVGDTHRALGPLAQAFAGWPVRKLVSIGVTGTNGKTTVACLIESVLAVAGYRIGRLSTIGYDTGQRRLSPATTTPDAIALAEMTAEMVQAGCSHVVIEVSSHALDQQRTSGVEFQVGVFTNLSGDHLDYHKTMEAYFSAKRRLFEQLSAKAVAVINRDDRRGQTLAEVTPAKVAWYGLSPAAELWAKIQRIDEKGSRFLIIRRDEQARVATPLIGRHNILNCLAAAAACLELGVELAAVAAGLERITTIRGRLERVPADVPYQVFVDYAHTDEALANVLSSLRPLSQGRIIVVFGCGGDRDRSKRPRMAAAAERLADRIVITSDNPRSEQPRKIIEDIVAGLGECGRAKTNTEIDRRAAIAAAIDQARPGDVVLIAGKGHECEQIVGDERIHFDDVEVALEILSRRTRP